MKRYDKPPIVRGLDFTDKEIQEARINRKLLSITLFTNNICNLRCLYCYRDAGNEVANETILEERTNVLLQAKKLGAKTLFIPGAGEPLCDPLFYDQSTNSFPTIEIANELGLHVVFFTNGTLITEKIAITLANKEVSIITKLNSFKNETQDLLSGVIGSYELMMHGVGHLLRAGFQKNQRLGIDSVIVKQNYSEIIDLFRFCRANRIIPYITTELHGGRGKNNAETLDVDKKSLQVIFNELLACDQLVYNYTWTPAPPIVAGNCNKLFYDIVVDNVGNIQLCPGINLSLGNIRNTSLSEALQSDLVKKVRNPQQYLKGKCAACKNKSCAYGCRLSAFTDSGDLFGEDPQCWKGD